MLSSQDLANIIGYSNVYVRNMVKSEMEMGVDYTRTNINNGAINILPQGASKILSDFGVSIKELHLSNFNIKGGIGKTSINASMAHFFSQFGLNGKKVLLIDTDFENCATSMLLDEPEEYPVTIYDVINENLKIVDVTVPTKYPGLDLLPSHVNVIKADRILSGKNPKKCLDAYLEGIFDKYSMVIWDMPPSLNNLTRAILLKLDKLNMIVNSDIFTIESTNLLLNELEDMTEEWEAPQPELTITHSRHMSSRIASTDASKVLRASERLREYIIDIQIKESASIANAINEGKTIIDCSHRDIRNSFVELCYYLVPFEISEDEVIQ